MKYCIAGLLVAVVGYSLPAWADTEQEATVLLLHGDGVAGTTNVVDTSAAARALTTSGHVQHASANSVFGGSSLYFDGRGDEIRAADSEAWNFGTNDFTIDLWVRGERANAPTFGATLLRQWEAQGSGFTQAGSWTLFDATTISNGCKGYRGALFDGRYVYFAPQHDGTEYHGRILRFDTRAPFASTNSWSCYDARATSGLDMKGFTAGAFDGRYAYFVGYYDGVARSSKILRFDTQLDFSNADAWTAYDAGRVGGLDTKGSISAIVVGHYLYLVPTFNGTDRQGRVVRYDTLEPFADSASWAVYDASTTGGLSTKGYMGAVTDGRFVYFVPFFDTTGPHGRVLRLDSEGVFTSSTSWAAFDADAAVGLSARSYSGGVYDGRYVYFAPSYANVDGSQRHGCVLRYDTLGSFATAASWSSFDAGAIGGLVTKGYNGAFFDGRYVYFVPDNDGTAVHGRFLRYDTQATFASAGSWSSYDAGSTGGQVTKCYMGAIFDGRYAYFPPASPADSAGRVLRYDTAPQGSFCLGWSEPEWGGALAGGPKGLGFCLNAGSVAYRLISGKILESNTWHHVAVTRAGAALRLFVDGAVKATNDLGTNAVVNSSSPLTLGRYPGAHSGFAGYLDEVRILKGYARWTAAFTNELPTAPYPDAVTIAGRVTNEFTGAGFDAVTVMVGTRSVTTTNGGYYSVVVPYAWSGSVTPVLHAATLSPATRDYDTVTDVQVNQNFGWRPAVPNVTTVSTSQVYSAGGTVLTLNGFDFRAPWYGASWAYRKRLTIDRTKVMGTLTNYPMLLSRVDVEWKSTANGGRVGQADGGDLVFTDATGVNKLAHEIEKYDPVTGELVAWVNVPLVATNQDTEIFVYYGNGSAADQWNATGTWNTNYKGVYHLNDPRATSDTFTGTSLDGSKWTSWGYVSVNNRLTLSADAANWSSSGVNGTGVFYGDFDVQVDYDTSGWTVKPPADAFEVVFCANTTVGSYGYFSTVFYTSSGTREYNTWQNETNGGWGKVTGAATAGKLRLVRSGSTIYSFYWNGSAWSLVGGSYTGPHAGDPVYLALYTCSRTSGRAVPAMYYDNFVVNSGERIWDSTANANHGASLWSQQASGLISTGRYFDGGNAYIEIKNSASLENLQENNYSIQAWYRPAVLPVDEPADNYDVHSVFMKQGNHEGLDVWPGYLEVIHWLTNGSLTAGQGPAPVAGQAYHMVGVVNRTAGTTKLFCNGQEGAGGIKTWTANMATREYGATPWRIGIGAPGAAQYRWPANGVIDEARLLATSLSPNWIATEYNNHSTPATFYDVGVQEALVNWTNQAVRVLVNGVAAEVLYVDLNRITIRLPTLTPGPVDVTVVAADGASATLTGLFDAMPFVAGRIINSQSARPLAGVTLAISGNASVTSDANGYYTQYVRYGWSGTLTPACLGATFTPASRNLDSVAQNLTGQDFDAQSGAPTIDTFLPSILPSTGGAWVEVNGSDFRGAWYNALWGYRKRLSIDRTKVSGILTNYPMLVSRIDAELKSVANGGRVGQVDGGDLLFTDATGTNKLAHEIEKYDPVTGELVAWVNVPRVATNRNTELNLYYGNAAAADQWNASGTWNANYKGVYHLNDPRGSGDDFTGATVNTAKWSPYGSYSINNNRLALTATAVNWNRSGADNFDTYYGDFDIQVDFDISAWTVPPTDGFECGLFLGTTDGLYSYNIYLYYSSAGVRSYNTWQSEGPAGWGSLSGAPATGKLRLIRNGSTLYAQYWTGSTWTQLGTFAGVHTGDKMYAALYGTSRTTGRALPATYFDNFTVTCGERIKDSTANANHGASTRSFPSGGILSTGRLFDGVNSFIEIRNAASVENLQESSYSIQAWYKPLVMPANVGNGSNFDAQGLFMKTGWHEGLTMWSNAFYTFHNFANDTQNNGNTYTPTLLGQNYSAVGVVDRSLGTTKIYVNGQPGSYVASWTPNAVTREYGTMPWRIGIGCPSGAQYAWPANGVVDEARLLATPLTAAWVATEYRNHSAPATFCAVGIEEAGSNWTNSGASRVYINGALVESLFVDSGQLLIRPAAHGAGAVPVLVLGPDGTEAVATATYDDLPLPVVSGRVVDPTTGLGLDAVLVAFGGTTNATSDANGTYAVTLPYGWSGAVTASRAGYGARPASVSLVDLQANITNLNWYVTPDVLPTGRDLEFYARYLKGNGSVSNYSVTTTYATIPVEFVNVQGNMTVSGTWSPGTATADQRMLIVRVEGDLTVPAGTTIIPSARKRGMILLVEGNVNVVGKISMTARGASGVAGDRLALINALGAEVAAVGGAGGGSRMGDNLPGNAGGNGSAGSTGGGGSGAANNPASVNTYPTSGAGSAGTSYSGGTAGGGAGNNVTGTAGSGAANGGAGGAGFGKGGGGAGNPRGAGGLNNGADGTGGLLVMYAGSNVAIWSTGMIEANGSRGADGDGSGTQNNAAGGGGSGGGSINLFYQGSYANAGSGNILVTGGSGGTGEFAVAGGAGGSGSIRTVPYTSTRQISGRVLVSASGNGLVGASIAASPSAATVLTTNGGYYTMTVSAGWSGTLTATYAGGAFVPTSRSIPALTADLANQDFAWAPPPVIAQVTPAIGPASGGTAVFITGTNFSASPLPTVRFGSKAATGVTRLSDTQLQVTAPANPVGRVAVSVIDPSGLTGVRSNAYRYAAEPPVASEVVPASGATVGGYGVQINYSGGALWGYRRKITLNPATTVTGQQVRVTLTIATFDYAAAQANGADLRFTQPDGMVLPHWIESWNTNGTSYVWVQAWDVGVASLYLSYGQPTAPDVGNGTATFDFFDDFNAADNTKFTYPANYAFANGTIRLWSDSTWRCLTSKRQIGPSEQLVLETKLMLPSSTSIFHFNMVEANDASGNYYRYCLRQVDNTLGIYEQYRLAGQSDWTYSPTLFTAAAGQWYIGQIQKRSDREFLCQVMNTDYAVLGSAAGLTNVGFSTLTWNWLGYLYTAENYYYDWWRARKYVSTPVTATLGARESSVLFDGVSASAVTILSATSVVAVAPAHGAGSVSVTLVSLEGGSNTTVSAFTYTPVISGLVTNTLLRAGIDNVLVTLSGGAGSALTAGGGYYTIPVSPGWSGTASVSLDAVYGTGVFTPATRSYGAVNDTQAGQNYAFLPSAPVIAGRILNYDTGTGEDGVTVNFSNGGGSTTTTNGGYYSRTVAYDWSGTVTFTYTTSRGPGVFTPASLTYANVRLNQANQDYSFDPPYFPGTRYVSLTGLNQWPYTNWEMAARSIQLAVNAAGSEDTVMVADGTYNLDSRLTITKWVTVKSQHGPAWTTIQRGTSAQVGVVRISGSGAVLDGFTVRGGYVCCNDVTSPRAGGIYASSRAVVQNCIIRDNHGGVYLGAGGLYLSGATAINCLILNNTAGGGDVYSAAGGVKMGFDAVLINCTVTGNSGPQAGVGMDGHGSDDQGTCWARNCIFQGNLGRDVSIGDGTLNMQSCAYGSVSDYGITYENCLASPAQFVNAGAGDYRLAESSPLINRGVTAYNPLSTDLAGAARVVNGAIDLGVYEYQNARPRLVGRVTHLDTGAGLAGITVNTTGGSLVTDSAGYYTRVVDTGWSGTVTPASSSGSFTPASRTYNNVTADVTGDFSWVGPPPVLYGRITQQNTGAGVDGVTVTFSNGGGTTTTAGGGYYSKQMTRYWTGTATPSYASGWFSPGSRSYTSLVADQGGQDFTWVPPTRAIAGRVTHAYTGAGVDGLTVTVTSVSRAITTNGGYYTAAVPLNWSGQATVLPGDDASVSPAYRDYSNVTVDQAAQDAVWTPADPVLSGRAYHAYTNGGVSGVTVTFSNGGGSLTTGAGGGYSKTLPWNWSGTVTVSYPSGGFAPASRSYASLQRAQSGQDYAWYPPARTISGTITHQETGAGIGGVTINIAGGGSVASAANGTWSYTTYSGWIGALAPVLAGGVFSPASRSYNNVTADQAGQNFTWGPDKTISGRVTNQANGVGMDGIVLSFSGSGNATTAGGGYYTRTVSYGWSGSVSLSGPAGSVFAPANRSYNNVTASQTGQDYGWQAPRSVSGRVTDQFSGAGVNGITVTLSNGGGEDTTAGGGYWSEAVPYGWSGTITASGSGTFNPASRTVNNLTSDLGGQDFAQTGPAPVISGKVAMQQTGAAQSGFTVTFSDGTVLTTSSDGTFSRTVTHGWSGTIVVSTPLGGSFSPAQRSYSGVYVDQASQNFTWIAPTYPVSGTVVHQISGTGVDGITVTFGGLGAVTTAGGGFYTQWVYRGWSGQATVSGGSGGTFTPASRSYANVTAAQSSQNYTFLPNRDLSGRIVDELTGGGVDGIAVNGSGSVVASGLSANGGYYSVTVTNGWSGTLTPSGAIDGTFGPASRTFVNVTASQAGLDFTVLPYRSLSGRITDTPTGVGIDGVPVSGSGVHAAGLTAGGGYYTVRVPSGWSGSLLPVLAGGSFTPSQRNYASVAADQVNQDYTWQAQQTISGVVTHHYSGAGVAGVTITFPGAGSTVSSSDGSYSMTVPRSWSGTAVPSYGSAGAFAPLSRTYGTMTSDQSGQNYEWTPASVAQVSGRVIDSFTGGGLDGVILALSGMQENVTTAGGGYWSQIVPLGWTGTITPSFGRSGTFSPGSRSPGTVNGDLGGLDFAWSPTLVAGDRYVSFSGNNTYPYTTWASAAHDPALAVKAAAAGETVWVTNGTYDLAATLTVTNAVRMYSVNGASYTTLRRSGSGSYGVLDVNHANSVIRGFTLRDGKLPGGAGGVNLRQGYLVNSIVRNNEGSGVALGSASAARVANVVVVRNTEEGIEGLGSVVNCTVADNGGAQVGASLVYNSIVVGTVNSPIVAYTLTSNPVSGIGNRYGDPLFVDQAAGNYHVRSESLAVNAGNNGYNTLPTDVDGQPRELSTVDMGAYELTASEGLAVALGDDPDPVPNGDRITWIVTALNAGPGSAANVAVTLPAPAGVTVLSNSAGGAYAAGVWSVGTVSAGGSAELLVWALATQAGVYTNIARISSSTATALPGYDVATNVTEILGPVTITNVAATSSSSTSVVEWASVVGLGYDIYTVDGPLASNTQWTKRAVMVASEDVRHYLDGSATPGSVTKRFYQVAFANQAPGTQHVWGVVRRSVNPGFTMMSAPLKGDGRFDGTFGEQLAGMLNGDNGGAGDNVGDEVYVLEGGGAWRTLYLDAQKVWRESNGGVSTLVLQPGQGFFVARYAGSTVLATFTGEVGNDGQDSIDLQPGWNLIGLSQGKSLALRPTLAAGSNGGPLGGSAEELADQLVMVKSDGSWRRMMYVQGWGAPYDGQWFDLSTFTIVTNTFEPGDAVYYFRQGGTMQVTF